MPTLKDVMPYEFGREFSDTPAYRFCDVETFKAYWRGKAIFISA